MTCSCSVRLFIFPRASGMPLSTPRPILWSGGQTSSGQAVRPSLWTLLTHLIGFVKGKSDWTSLQESFTVPFHHHENKNANEPMGSRCGYSHCLRAIWPVDCG